MNRVCDKKRGEDNGRCILTRDDKLLVDPVYSRLSLNALYDNAIPVGYRKVVGEIGPEYAEGFATTQPSAHSSTIV
ncbi:Uncharacterized protein HZ326_6854 [Fusarium oxysporum f. sp. albedinis]|nr:Uncharacterized protein HZ326_6854 [Fusarium oxysporum f. sp. albedinis]